MALDFTFPENFVWGASTASYQIEGAVDEGGRGKSTWDVFCDQPGRIINGDSGAVACNHYNRWKDDIALMKELNLGSYRFSLAWSRIFPDGDGALNKEGVDFYDKLIDGLLEEGITPWTTLFHWDLPYSLQERFGGWRSLETVKRFADYASFSAEKYGDRVKNWFTINEIMCFTIQAHRDDRFAPGGKLPAKEVNQTVHNALLGHGFAAGAIREARSDARVGLVENLETFWPLWENDKNVDAARKAFHDNNQQRLFPALTGRYNRDLYEAKNGPIPDVADGDMEIIATPCDFIAYNFYNGSAVVPDNSPDGYREIDIADDFPRTAMGWPITPRALYWTLKFSSEYFPDTPVYITENGIALNDIEERDGAVMDIGRIEYYRQHLEMCSRAIHDGANLAGYFAWSLMDNFEWAEGYSKRFGLIRVNYRNGKRTIKASGKYYAELIRAGKVL